MWFSLILSSLHGPPGYILKWWVEVQFRICYCSWLRIHSCTWRSINWLLLLFFGLVSLATNIVENGRWYIWCILASAVLKFVVLVSIIILLFLSGLNVPNILLQIFCFFLCSISLNCVTKRLWYRSLCSYSLFFKRIQNGVRCLWVHI